MRGECPKLKRMIEKKKKKDIKLKGKMTKAMVATWSNDDTSSDSHDSTSIQESDDEMCFMAFEEGRDEVNSNLGSLSTQEWEEAYELLHEKCKKLKR